MKNLLTILSMLFMAHITLAQPPSYDDLKILYADANYEKLVKVGQKYTENDKTKKHTLPYIWTAKGFYKISLSGSSDDRFKNAYKDAIKYLGKGIKYDLKYNEGAKLEDHQEFIEQFQMSLMEVIGNEIEAGNYKKAYSWSVKYQKVTRNLVGVKYMMGACKHRDQDKPTARTLWQEANKGLTEIAGVDDWSEADRMMLKLGIINSAAAMKDSRQVDKARELLNKAAQWFEEDEDWQELYDEAVN